MTGVSQLGFGSEPEVQMPCIILLSSTMLSFVLVCVPRPGSTCVQPDVDHVCHYACNTETLFSLGPSSCETSTPVTAELGHGKEAV